MTGIQYKLANNVYAQRYGSLTWYDMVCYVLTLVTPIQIPSFCMHFLVFLFCVLDAQFPEPSSVYVVDQTNGCKGKQVCLYSFREQMLSRYLVFIACIRRYEVDISRPYSRSLRLSTLFKIWAVFLHRNCAIFYFCQSALPNFCANRKIWGSFLEFSFSSTGCQS